MRIAFVEGGTVLTPAAAFGAFNPFGPRATFISGHYPALAALYPPPLYWSYPSPPVSPTTYYGPTISHSWNHAI